MTAILQATGLRKSYRISAQPRMVLDGIDLSIERGEFVALMGPSGEGKSTLLHVISGLDLPDAGHVVVDGQDITTMSEEQRTLFRRSHIGFVFQFFNLLPTLTAAENVALPFRIAGDRRRDTFDRVSDVMNKLNLRGLQGHRPEEISGGEQQRVALARAFVTEPTIIMADEPTGNLDFNTGNEVMRVMSQFNQDGQTVVLATHDARAAAHADRVLVLRQGKVAAEIALPRGESDPRELIARLQALGL